jgi:hypothetical protein
MRSRRTGDLPYTMPHTLNGDLNRMEKQQVKIETGAFAGGAYRLGGLR